MGYKLDDARWRRRSPSSKRRSRQKKKEVFDEDIESGRLMINWNYRDAEELAGLQVTAGSNTIPTATVTLRDSSKRHCRTPASAMGRWTLFYSAIQRLTGVTVSLTDYRIRSDQQRERSGGRGAG